MSSPNVTSSTDKATKFTLDRLAAWFGQLWRGHAYFLISEQLNYEREEHKKKLEAKEKRIADLEKKVDELLDRILLIRSVPPINLKQEKKPVAPRQPGFMGAIEEAMEQRERTRALIAKNARNFAQKMDGIDELDNDLEA